MLVIRKNAESDHVAILERFDVLILIGDNKGRHFKSIQRLFNFPHEGLDINWFLDIINGSHIKGFFYVHDICHGRDNDHGNSPGVIVFLQLVKELITADLGHE